MKKLLLLTLLLPLNVLAVESDYVLVIKDHQFQPAELSVPAGKKIKIVIENRDASPEEFESHSLNREKLIAANGSVSIYIGPLTVGRYPFYGEFNEATAQGVIVAK
jgi:hypothetical protein